MRARSFTYSFYIERIVALLRASHIKVSLRSPHLARQGVAGRYDHKARRIWVNEPNAYLALLTLAHEAGHWMGYAFARKRANRERQALVYGWRVLCLVGADRIVGRPQWWGFHMPWQGEPSLRRSEAA